MSSDRREERQAALRRRLVVEELDALLVLHPPNIRYLTGFTGSAGLLLVFAERTVLLTDFRYAEQAPQEAGGSAQVVMEPSDVWGRLRKLLDAACGYAAESGAAVIEAYPSPDGRAYRYMGTRELCRAAGFEEVPVPPGRRPVMRRPCGRVPSGLGWKRLSTYWGTVISSGFPQ